MCTCVFRFCFSLAQMRTCLALLITGVLLLLAITHGTALSCPSYASIAQPSVADFDPVKYQVRKNSRVGDLSGHGKKTEKQVRK